MSEEKKEEKKEEKNIERKEVRKFTYTGESAVGFEFEIDVSSPGVAVAEIADFIALMTQSSGDLEKLAQDFAKKVGKTPKKEPKKKKERPVIVVDRASS